MADEDLLIGKTIGDGYRVERLVRADALGRLFQASRRGGAPGAIAVFAVEPEHASDPTRCTRFDGSAPVLKSLDDPNIAKIHEIGRTPDGRVCVVSDFPAGVPLSDLLDRRGKMQLGPAVRMVRRVGQALAAAHLKRLVHHDIRPQNVYLSGEPKRQACRVLGFGLAEFKDASVVSPTSSAISVATASYVAPEQARGDVCDHRADVYSTGALLFAALTGRAPVDPLSGAACPSPRSIEPSIPEAVEAVILRAMSPDPADRYKFMNQFDVELMPHDDHEADLLDEMLDEFDNAFDLESSDEDRHTPPRPIMVKVPDPMEGKMGAPLANGGQAEPAQPAIPKAPAVPRATPSSDNGPPRPGAILGKPLVNTPPAPNIETTDRDDSPTLRPPRTAAGDEPPTPPRGVPAPDLPDFFEDEDDKTPPKLKTVKGPQIAAPKVAKLPTPPSVRGPELPPPTDSALSGDEDATPVPGKKKSSVPAPPPWLKSDPNAAASATDSGSGEPADEEDDGYNYGADEDDDDAATMLFDASRVRGMIDDAKAEEMAGKTEEAEETDKEEDAEADEEPEKADDTADEEKPLSAKEAAAEEEAAAEKKPSGLQKKEPAAEDEPEEADEPEKKAAEKAAEPEEDEPKKKAVAAEPPPPDSVAPSKPAPQKKSNTNMFLGGAVVIGIVAVVAWQSGILGGGDTQPAPIDTAAPQPKPGPTAAKTGAPKAPETQGEALRDQFVKAVENSQSDAAIEALEQITELDWKLLDSPESRSALQQMLLTQAGRPNAKQTDEVYELAATKLGSIGPDLLFELYTTRGGSQAAARAWKLLGQDAVKKLASPALLVAYELRAAVNCDRVQMLLKAAKADGDIRAKIELSRIRSCASGTKCCMRGDPTLAVVIGAIGGRKGDAPATASAEPTAEPATTAAPKAPAPTKPWTPPPSTAPAKPPAKPTAEPAPPPSDGYEDEDF